MIRDGIARTFAATRLLGAALALVSGLVFTAARAEEESSPAVLVELFTSQGCYRCPPADRFMAELTARSEVVGLSLNVDYYNYLGWEDPLAQAAYTARQRAYVNAHRETSVYTPHLVVNGARGVTGSDRDAVAAALESAQAKPRAVVIALKREQDKLIISVTAKAADAAGVVMAAPYRRAVTQNIGAGDNAGETITNYNAALTVQKIGSYAGGAESFAMDLPSEAEGVAVWVQKEMTQGPVGEVLCAAKLEL